MTAGENDWQKYEIQMDKQTHYNLVGKEHNDIDTDLNARYIINIKPYRYQM